MSKQLSFLRVEANKIVDAQAKAVKLRGVNLGAWLMMEGYLLHGRNFGEHLFKEEFAKTNGGDELKRFSRLYRDNFITCQDIQRIKKMGVNCVRLPFNYRLIEQDKGWGYLDGVISWCKKEGIWVILDLHAAPGAQNPDWHSDSCGRALFWNEKRFQKLYSAIWRRIARRYRKDSTVAGYDVLNEPVVKNTAMLRRFYREVVEEIRQVDQEHLLFLEANDYGQVLEPLGRPRDKNIVYSIHVYQPINFTFNFQPHLKYPGYIDAAYWDKRRVERYLLPYQKLSEKWQVPIYVGEFGVNFRSPEYYGELRYLEDVLKCFQRFGFHWTYWTYKAVAGGLYPDGIYQYLPNPPWVKREGPLLGWENFYRLWKTHKHRITASWKTENFTENKYLSALLSKYV